MAGASKGPGGSGSLGALGGGAVCRRPALPSCCHLAVPGAQGAASFQGKEGLSPSCPLSQRAGVRQGEGQCPSWEQGRSWETLVCHPLVNVHQPRPAPHPQAGWLLGDSAPQLTPARR